MSGLKSGLMEALDNWCMRLADSTDLVGLLLRVQCIHGLMIEGMNQWMNTTGRGYIGCTKVAKSIKVGQRSRKLRTVESWQAHIAEEAAIDSWWLQLQENSEGRKGG